MTDFQDECFDVDAGARCGGESVGEHGPVGVVDDARIDPIRQLGPDGGRAGGIAEHGVRAGSEGGLVALFGSGLLVGTGGAAVAVVDAEGGAPDGEVGEQSVISPAGQWSCPQGSGRWFPGAGVGGDVGGESGDETGSGAQVWAPRWVLGECGGDAA